MDDALFVEAGEGHAEGEAAEAAGDVGYDVVFAESDGVGLAVDGLNDVVNGFGDAEVIFEGDDEAAVLVAVEVASFFDLGAEVVDEGGDVGVGAEGWVAAGGAGGDDPAVLEVFVVAGGGFDEGGVVGLGEVEGGIVFGLGGGEALGGGEGGGGGAGLGGVEGGDGDEAAPGVAFAVEGVVEGDGGAEDGCCGVGAGPVVEGGEEEDGEEGEEEGNGRLAGHENVFGDDVDEDVEEKAKQGGNEDGGAE